MKNNILRILAYTGLESILYQAILCIHQIMLFYTLNRYIYGKSGILFSLIFLCALYANAGLDVSLPTFFTQAKTSQYSFKRLILAQILGNLCITCAAITLLYACFSMFFSFESLTVYIYCALLILIESTKKTVRDVLHLALFQKTVALVENATLLLYILTVWTLLLSGCSQSVDIVLAPMIASSLIALVIYIYIMYFFYKRLNATPKALISWKQIIHTRLNNYLYQITKSLYSGNFLIPIIAKHCGVEFVALLKIISMSAYSINSIIKHAFGITSNILFSYMKNRSFQYKKKAFTLLTTYIHNVLFILCLAMLLHHSCIGLIYPHICYNHIQIIYLFLLVIFSENAIVTHEHFFIVEGRTYLLIISNLAFLIPLFIIHYTNITLSVLSILLILLIMRALAFAGFSIYSWYTWNIQLSINKKPIYLSASAALAFLFLLLF